MERKAERPHRGLPEYQEAGIMEASLKAAYHTGEWCPVDLGSSNPFRVPG
jgi:hypothetical protein